MLVALPSAIAFGVTIFSPLGGRWAAEGAIAGILGTIALGIVAATFGGTNRLITAPCAPAAAVLAALAIQLTQKNMPPESVLLLMTLVALLCGALQILFGVIRLGRLIKYMPYPVVSGYLSGVGLIIIISQVPKLFGVPSGTPFWKGLFSPSLWVWHGLAIGGVTIGVMLLAPKLTKAVPAAILALASGILTYFGLSFADKSLLTLAENKLVIGQFGGSGGGFLTALVGRWQAIAALNPSELTIIITPALTLAVLLSIDTLKTCVVLDALTRSRHNSNRELIGQGLGNLATTVIGGVPGAGQMGATLVNISSGGQTRMSGVIEGTLALLAFLVLGKLIAWVPIAALAGILIVVGFRMFDRNSLHLLKSRSTILDFAVIVAVVVVAETVSLIAASGVGIALAILLFIREQVGGSVVRRITYGNQMFSKHVRLPEEMEILEKYGDRTVIFELQGSLFFGTTDQLYTALEPELKKRKYVVLDMRRVHWVDVTAAHMLEQIEDTLHEHRGYLIFSHFPHTVPSGRDLEGYMGEVGIVRPEHHRVRVFESRDEALQWIEDRTLNEVHVERVMEQPLELREMSLFAGRKEETLVALEACLETRSYKAGEKIFSRGDQGDELFLIRRGAVRVVLPVAGKLAYHLATFGRGDFLGEMTFLDREPRSADAIAFTDVELLVLSRARFDTLASEHKKLAIQLLEGLARTIAIRLRRANTELRALQEG
ncbi:MAG: SulP family inorganic anion transporter [Acidobacteria bacterium]|nr:SulP family inorganic anion transporter [Acidobacteriota bacterium]MCL5287163.1 SulP family inorganic anion transporter [Acidobacteriota bacterium]